MVSSRCTGCGRCVAVCDPHVLWLEVIDGRKRALLHDAPGCTGCSLCVRVCPFDAITMQAARAGRADPLSACAPP